MKPICMYILRRLRRRESPAWRQSVAGWCPSFPTRRAVRRGIMRRERTICSIITTLPISRAVLTAGFRIPPPVSSAGNSAFPWQKAASVFPPACPPWNGCFRKPWRTPEKPSPPAPEIYKMTPGHPMSAHGVSGGFCLCVSMQSWSSAHIQAGKHPGGSTVR